MDFTLDAWLFHWMFQWLHQIPWLPVLSWLTHLGDPRSILFVAVLGFLETTVVRRKMARLGDKGNRPAVLPWLGIPLAALVTGWLKEMVGRSRPAEIFSILKLGLDPREIGRSFPSGHAVGIFALARILSLRWPKGRGGWWSIAVGVALSRVALGMHWPSDVAAGALIGLGSVEFFVWLEQKKTVQRR
ncbi:MAG: phosphatase PAP2 family protein [Candidatus Omnitrophica bacterium]|nr:phosphatase PAP2 family protein [Candidatus Omnitrophota bacterium]